MAILMTLEVPGATVEQYERANEIMGIRNDADAPDGLILHVCGLAEAGLLVQDVWASHEKLDAFFESRLGAALHEAGAPEARPTIEQVHNVIRSRAAVSA